MCRMKPYISIIVPVFNVKKYLCECINTLLYQNIDSNMYEIILVDDGSTDGCSDICDNYAKTHTNINVYHKENGGLSDARNYGMQKAAGVYVLFVDADDYIEINVLENIIEECKKQKEPDVFFLQAKKVYTKNKLVVYDEPMDIDELQKGRKYAITYIMSRKMYPASAWSKMVKQSLLIDNKIIFKKGQLSEDYEWSLKIYCTANSYGAYNGEYYYYRKNRKGSITSRITEKHFCDLLEIVENMEREAYMNKENTAFILNSAAYVYRVILWYSSMYYKKYKNRIEKKQYLLDKRNSKDICLLRKAKAMIGIKNVVELLAIYRKVLHT